MFLLCEKHDTCSRPGVWQGAGSCLSLRCVPTGLNLLYLTKLPGIHDFYIPYAPVTSFIKAEGERAARWLSSKGLATMPDLSPRPGAYIMEGNQTQVLRTEQQVL